MSNYFGGVPTDLDIKKIRSEFPDLALKDGQRISYEEIAGLIKEPVRSNRFRSVTTRWRKLIEEESNIIVGCVDGRAFVVLTDGQKLGLAGTKFRSAVKHTRRARKLLARTDRNKLSKEERERFDHQDRNTAAILLAAQQKSPKALPDLKLAK